jgi:hypothetical protein
VKLSWWLFLLAAGLGAQPPRPVAAKNEVDPPQQQQQAQQSQQPGIKRSVMQVVEKSIDKRLFDGLNPADPADLMGNTRGVYMPGFGVVLTAEIALVKLPGPSPFHQTASQDERTKAHARKLQALPKLREAMKAMLIAAGAELRSVPLNENIVVGVTLFNYFWEDSTGLPAQIVMQASRQQLVTQQASDAIKVQEF